MWAYGSVKIDDDLIIQYLVRVIKVKWWNKFNHALLKKEKIDEWLQVSKIHKPSETTPSALTKESIFIPNKQKLMAALSIAMCEEEFNQIIKSISRSSSQKDEGEEEVGSSLDQYDNNEDDCYGFFSALQ
ncbi:hypothetical protein SESBI_38506 [Sesbania bispinosa]|nr:hypothetical protein SESBI_38506 [Sesbania bispinosa]